MKWVMPPRWVKRFPGKFQFPMKLIKSGFLVAWYWELPFEGEASSRCLHVPEALHVALQPRKKVQVGVVSDLLVVEERWGMVFPQLCSLFHSSPKVLYDMLSLSGSGIASLGSRANWFRSIRA